MKQSRSTPGKQSAPARSPKTASETFRVAGISYYPDAIKGLARLNPDWKLSPEEIFASDKTGQKIYKCKFTTSPVQLIPEPENPHDPNTIAVTIAGEKIGYVPRETAPLIGSILKKCEVKSIACGIIGGQYKVVDDNLNIETGKSSTTITVKITYYEPTVSSAPAEIISPPKGSFLELLLCWLLGYLGVHKFYRKKKGMGFLYLFTIGLFGIGWIGDSIYLTIRFISSLRGKAPTKKQKYGSYIAVALCFLVLGSCGGNKGPATETIPTSLPTESVSIQESKIATIPSETEIITETTATEDILTTGQKNALKAAESYLNYSAFSYSGLIKQLEYEKYTTDEATFAADNCDADWSAQALRAAEDYLDYSAFSYAGLIKQLEYEGYTSDQAAYGADNCEADWFVQAARSAESYLEYSTFSREGLIDQLEYEGFTSEQAVYGVDNCSAEWGGQAETIAKSTEVIAEPTEYQTTYVLNTNTKKFHYESCSSAKKIKDENRSIFIGSRDELIAQKYVPCGNCHP